MAQLSEPFVRRFHVGWGAIDVNAHMRNTAYLDAAADVRMMYFEHCGVPMSAFQRHRIGPVVMRDELEYRRELRLLEQMEVTIELAGLSDDGSRFRIRNTFYRPDGKVAATVTTEAGWLQIDTRRLTAPPPEVLEAVRRLPRADDFAPLPSSMRTRDDS